MAVVYRGTDVIGSSSGSSVSGTVTVPSDATGAVVIGSRYSDSNGRQLTGATLGTGGDQVTFTVDLATESGSSGEFVHVASAGDISALAGGNETLALTFGGGSNGAIYYHIVFFSGHDDTDVVRAHDYDVYTSQNDNVSTSATSSTGDLAVAYGYCYNANPSISSGYTQLAVSNASGERNRMAYKAAGSSSTAASISTNGYPVNIIAIIKAGASEATVSPVDVALSTSLDAASVLQTTFAVSPADVTLGLSVDVGAVTQTSFSVFPDDVGLSAAIDQASVTQQTVLVPVDVALGLSLDAADVLQTSFEVSPVDVALSAAIDAGTVLQTSFEVSPADVTLSALVDAASVSEDAVNAVSPVDVALSIALDAAAIEQTSFAIDPADVALTLATDVVDVTQTSFVISPDSVTIGPSLDATEAYEGAPFVLEPRTSARGGGYTGLSEYERKLNWRQIQNAVKDAIDVLEGRKKAPDGAFVEKRRVPQKATIRKEVAVELAEFMPAAPRDELVVMAISKIQSEIKAIEVERQDEEDFVQLISSGFM